MLAALATLILSGQPVASLADEDPEKRLEAVANWARKNPRPQLSSKEARALKDCVVLPAVKGSGCTQSAKLCRLHEGDDGSSGTRIESVSLTLEGHEKSLRAWWTATYEPQVKECDPPEELEGHETDEQRNARIAAWRKGHPREYAGCLKRVKKKAEADAEVLECDVVLANACRHEAFVTCRARNLRKGITALEHLHRFEF